MASVVGATATPTTSSSTDPPFYFDEKWRMSKKETLTRTRSSSFPLIKNSSHRRRCSFSRKCARLVKEQRARFYIMRRCVTMLICWHDYTDSWSYPLPKTVQSTYPKERFWNLPLFPSWVGLKLTAPRYRNRAEIPAAPVEEEDTHEKEDEHGD